MKSLIFLALTCLVVLAACAVSVTADAGVTVELKAVAAIEPACETTCVRPTPVRSVLKAVEKRVKERPLLKKMANRNVIVTVKQRVERRPLLRKIRQRVRCTTMRLRCR